MSDRFKNRPTIDEIRADQDLIDILLRQQSPESALEGELGLFKNPDGSISSEKSTTVTHPSLNNGKPTNIPLLVRGQGDDAIKRILEGKPSREDEGRAIVRALERQREGLGVPSFLSIPIAVTAAKERSNTRRNKPVQSLNRNPLG